MQHSIALLERKQTMGSHSPNDRRRRGAAAGTIVVIGGAIVVDGAPIVTAASFEVTNTNADGAGSLRDAINQANATAAADTITFASGLTGTITLTNTAKIKNDLEIVGPGISDITITSSAGNILYAYNTAALTISSLTFDQAPQDAIHGGNTGDVDISDVVITNSFDDGIQIDTGGALMVTDSVITDSGASGIAANQVGAVVVERTSTNSHGNNGLYLVTFDSFEGTEIVSTGHGGVSLRAMGANGNEPVRIVDSMFGMNNEYGVDISGVGDVTIEGTTIEGNNQAGAYIRSSKNLTIDDSTLTMNNGPGIFGRNLTSVTVSDTTIADSNTDGIHLELVSGTVVVTGSTVARSAEQGAEFIDVAGGVRLTNSTITENTAAGTNPVVLATNSDLLIEHATVAGNLDVSPPDSTAIGLDTSDLVLDHAIIAGNAGMPSVLAGAGSTVTAVDYSVVSSGSGFAGTSIELADPMLLALDDNGGPTETMLPAIGSPVVEAGDPGFAAPPIVDQRGEARVDGVIDIGAVEGEEQPVVVVPIASVASLAPARFVDTRSGQPTIDGQFAGAGKRIAGSEYRIKLAGRGMVPADAEGVVVNVTAVAPDNVGFVTVHPCVATRPNASSLNYSSGVALGNEIVAGLNGAGEACFYTSAAAHLTVDVVGYVPKGSSTSLLTPARLMDSRPGQSTVDGQFAGQGIRTAGSATNLMVNGRGGVPSDAAAVIVNVTAVGPNAAGFVTVHPCLASLPTAASLNFTAGTNRGNELIAEVSAAGEICLFTSGGVHLTVDVVGYVPAGSSLTPTGPARLLDTRPGEITIDGQNAGSGQRLAGSELMMTVAGRAGVPVGVTAAVINVTSVGATGTGFVTVHPCVTPRPLASSLNYVGGVNGGNEIIATLDSNGAICLYTSEQTQLTADVVAYLT